MIAKSFERIHRSNLVGMGIIPLRFKSGDDAETLQLTGLERFTVDLPERVNDIEPGQDVNVTTDSGKSFTCKLCLDTRVHKIISFFFNIDRSYIIYYILNMIYEIDLHNCFTLLLIYKPQFTGRVGIY